MPYQEITDRFPIPPDHSILSRYYSKEKFTSLIETSTLYFSRIDRFPNLDEIIFSLYDKAWIRNRYQTSGQEDWEEKAEKEIEMYESLKKCSYLNCWTIEYSELRKFWQEYGNSSDAVLVRTSMKKLKTEIDKCKFNTHIAGVIYYDPVSTPVGTFNTTRMLARKPNDFKWEKEVRIIISRFLQKEEYPDHHIVNIDVKALIDEIIISPFSSPDYFEQVKLLVSSVGIDTKIIKPSSIKLD